MNIEPDRLKLLRAVLRLRAEVCAYSADPCDCKFGLGSDEPPSEEQTGCPELATLAFLLASLGDGDWAHAIASVSHLATHHDLQDSKALAGAQRTARLHEHVQRERRGRRSRPDLHSTIARQRPPSTSARVSAASRSSVPGADLDALSLTIDHGAGPNAPRTQLSVHATRHHFDSAPTPPSVTSADLLRQAAAALLAYAHDPTPKIPSPPVTLRPPTSRTRPGEGIPLDELRRVPNPPTHAPSIADSLRSIEDKIDLLRRRLIGDS